MSMQSRVPMPYNPMAINKYPPPPPPQGINMNYNKNPMMQMNRGYPQQNPMSQQQIQFHPPPPPQNPQNIQNQNQKNQNQQGQYQQQNLYDQYNYHRSWLNTIINLYKVLAYF